jgi:hypothetical protein
VLRIAKVGMLPTTLAQLVIPKQQLLQDGG